MACSHKDSWNLTSNFCPQFSDSANPIGGISAFWRKFANGFAGSRWAGSTVFAWFSHFLAWWPLSSLNECSENSNKISFIHRWTNCCAKSHPELRRPGHRLHCEEPLLHGQCIWHCVSGSLGKPQVPGPTRHPDWVGKPTRHCCQPNIWVSWNSFQILSVVGISHLWTFVNWYLTYYRKKTICLNNLLSVLVSQILWQEKYSSEKHILGIEALVAQIEWLESYLLEKNIVSISISDIMVRQQFLRSTIVSTCVRNIMVKKWFVRRYCQN